METYDMKLILCKSKDGGLVKKEDVECIMDNNIKLCNDVERLEQSNKELLDALKTLHRNTLYRLSKDDTRNNRPSAELFDNIENLINGDKGANSEGRGD